MRRRRTGAQLLRVGVRGAGRMSVQVDDAADVEPEAAGRKGRDVHTANVRLAADGRQAFTRRLGCDLRIALRAGPAVERADERCAQRGPALAVDMAARCAVTTTAGRNSKRRAMRAACERAAAREHLPPGGLNEGAAPSGPAAHYSYMHI